MGKIITGKRLTPQSTVHIFGDQQKKVGRDLLYFTISSILNKIENETPEERSKKKTGEKKARFFWKTLGSLKGLLDPKWYRTFDNTVQDVLRDVEKEAARQSREAAQKTKESKKT